MKTPALLVNLRGWLRRHYGKLLAAALLLAGTAVGGPRLLWGPETVVQTVVQRDFVQTIVASGRVETPHRVAVGVQVAGTVSEVPVMEGQVVAAGTPLIVLESSELRAALAQADSGAQQALARLRQVVEVQGPVAEQALRQAQSNHVLAEAALARSRELFEKGFIGRAALDEAERAERVAEAQWRSAQRQLASTRPAGSDVAAARASVAQARATVEAARARFAYATVRAPAAGVVMTRSVEPGDAVQPGKVLMVLTPGGETQVVAQIDEKHLGLLRPGLHALVSADAYERERFPAELVFIHPGIDPQRGSVEVKLRVPAPPAYLRQDMTVSLDIEVARRPAAVLVPTDAVHDAFGPRPWVWKVEQGRLVRQTFVPGVRTAAWTEVRQGLAAGDTVLPAGAQAASEGQRVRVTIGTPAS
jgi:HlyD family secretion protein